MIWVDRSIYAAYDKDGNPDNLIKIVLRNFDLAHFEAKHLIHYVLQSASVKNVLHSQQMTRTYWKTKCNYKFKQICLLWHYKHRRCLCYTFEK